VSLLENQLDDITDLESRCSRLSDDNVSDLESQVSRLNDDLDSQAEQIERLKNEAVQMKVSFADCVLNLQRACPAGSAGSSFSSSSASGLSYASVARGNISGSVLVAKCADASLPPPP
jgi:outer membrane murein-binding lipoprotein Lpp